MEFLNVNHFAPNIFDNINKVYQHGIFNPPAKDERNKLSLTQAKNELNLLNDQLNCIDYRVSIDYISDLPQNTNICSYSQECSSSQDLPDNLIICIFTMDNKCVSSLELYVDLDNKFIEINSRTKEEFQGKKMNKLLRTMIVLLAPKIHPNIKGIKSTASNPISAHLMINTLNATPYIEDSFTEIPKADLNLFSKIKAFMIDEEEADEDFKEINVIDTIIFITDENINNAMKVFKNLIQSSFCQQKGGGTKRRKKYNHHHPTNKKIHSRKIRRKFCKYTKQNI